MAITEKVYYVTLHPIRELYWAIRHPRKLRVKCLVHCNGHFLYVKNRYLKYWTLPGGFVRRMTYESLLDESPEGAIKKLLKDDLGIMMKSLTPLTEYRTVERMGRKDTIDCFFAEAKSAEFHIRDMDMWEAEWFPVDHPPSPLGMSARTILGMYKAAEGKKQ